MKEEIDFSKTYEHAVRLFDDTSEELGSGTLVFGDSKWAHFKFDEFAAATKFDEQQKFSVLKAKTRSGDSFTLFECVFSGFVIHVDYVVSGDVSGRFSEVVIRFSDITEWFMRQQRLDGKLGESISWVNHPQPLSATVKTSTEHFSLKSEVESECTHTGEDYLIHEHVVFCYQNLEGLFSAKAIQGKTLELLALLSILIAYPLSIVSVWVKDESGRYSFAYFPTYKRIERDASEGSFANKCLVSKPAVDGKWQAIVDGYYNSDYRKVSWVRLAGMQRYEGFWEYETLGYVSMLDKFVTQYAKQQIANPTVPLSTKLVNFNQSLSNVLPALSESQRQGIVSLADKAFAGTREPNFSEKYQHAIASSNKDVIQIINISDDDFALIKRIRDKVAHGDAIDFIGRDVSTVTGIVQKITLLLTFWAFRDFGFTAREFINCLRGNHNPLVMNSSLDTVHRERVTGTAKFYKVSKEEFDRLSAKKGKMISCFAKDSEGLVEYSETYTATYRKWREEHSNFVGDMKTEDIFGLDKIWEYAGEAYMEYGKEHLAFYDVFVINEG